MKAESAFSIVVLPEPVPPEMMKFARALTADLRNMYIGSLMAPRSSRSSAVSLSLLNLRILRDQPLGETFGWAACTRDPSASVASISGNESSQRRFASSAIRPISRPTSSCETRSIPGQSTIWPSTSARATGVINVPFGSTPTGSMKISATLGSSCKGCRGPRPMKSSMVLLMM